MYHNMLTINCIYNVHDSWYWAAYFYFCSNWRGSLIWCCFIHWLIHACFSCLWNAWVLMVCVCVCAEREHSVAHRIASWPWGDRQDPGWQWGSRQPSGPGLIFRQLYIIYISTEIRKGWKCSLPLWGLQMNKRDNFHAYHLLLSCTALICVWT